MPIELTAFDISRGSAKCYLTTMKASELFERAKVSRADTDPEEGYQRLLSESRAKNIAKYLDEGRVIPGSIILSANKEIGLSFDSEKNLLTLPDECYFLVIDGQHRLYGAHYAEDKNVILPVCIFHGLSLSEEIQYFLDVNSTQKGVPKTLRIELTKFLSEPGSKDDIRLQLFKLLNTELESPLCGRMSATQSIAGKISNVSFQDAIDPILEIPIVKNYNFDDKYKLLLNFLKAIENVLILTLGDSKKLSTTAFFLAMFKNFENICGYAIMKHKNYKAESFEDILSEPFKLIEFDKFSGSNNQTISQLASEIKDQMDLSFANKNDASLL